MAEELKELEYTINGMDCADCALTIERGVSQLEGVVSCRASFASEKMYVYGSAADEDIAQRVREMGYGLKDNRQSSQPEKVKNKGNFFKSNSGLDHEKANSKHPLPAGHDFFERHGGFCKSGIERWEREKFPVEARKPLAKRMPLSPRNEEVVH